MENEKRILSIDSQILDAIQKCSFYTFLLYVKNYRTNETAVLLERGDLGHVTFQTYYELLKIGTSFEDAVKQSSEVAREHYQNLHLDIGTSEWVIQSFYQYANFYKFDSMKVLGVEEAFTMKLYEDDDLIIVYQGKIDLHCELPIIGESMMDHKWRGQKVEYTPLDNQIIGYATYTKSNLVYINEVGLQKSYEPKDKFRRVPLLVSDGVKKRWIKNTIAWGKILDFNLQENIWPQSHLKVPPIYVSQCNKCTYKDVCNSETDEEMARKLEDMFYLSERWDVGKTLEKPNEETTLTQV